LTQADPPEHNADSRERSARTTALFEQLESSPDQAERDRLRGAIAELHLPLVGRLANRYSGRGESHDDLVQAASVGLMKAIDRYRLDRRTEFLHFAIPTITGELKRYFRDSCWTVRPPRRIQELRAEIRSAGGELRQTTQREPTSRDLAAAVSTDVREVDEALSAATCYSPASLDTPAEVGLGGLMPWESEDGYEQVDTQVTLASAVCSLPERERYILGLRFYKGLTQREIADEIGVTQMQVSRLLARTMAILREELRDAVA